MKVVDGTTARTIHGDEKTGGTETVAPTLVQRQGYRPTFAIGNKLGGRKPAALELRAREFILKCINGEAGVKKLIAKIFALALKGQFRQQELLLNYILGKPTERVKIENASSDGVVFNPVVKIIADHLRLEKLERDSAAAPTVVEEDRVKEMEAILNKEIEKPIPVEEEKPTRAPKQKRNGVPIRKHKLKRAKPKGKKR